MITWNEFPVPRDCHNLLRGPKIGSRTYDEEKLQELALPRLASRVDLFSLFSRQKEPGSRYAMKKQKYQFRAALDIKAIDWVDRERSFLSWEPHVESEKVKLCKLIINCEENVLPFLWHQQMVRDSIVFSNKDEKP